MKQQFVKMQNQLQQLLEKKHKTVENIPPQINSQLVRLEKLLEKEKSEREHLVAENRKLSEAVIILGNENVKLHDQVPTRLILMAEMCV